MSAFEEVADEQGWDDNSKISVLIGFIAEFGYREEFDRYAQYRADVENDNVRRIPWRSGR